jgi:Aromatic ring hydroxylase
VRGRAGVSAEERIALFKLAWDVTGDAFAQRMAQYVRFYSGDPIRLTAGFYSQYDKGPLFELVERALGRREGPAHRRVSGQSGRAHPLSARHSRDGGHLRRHLAPGEA